MSRWKKRLAASVLALLVYEALVLALDRLGLVERLLSPSGAGVAVALVAALVMYALRLALVFIAPGVLVGWALCAANEARPGGGVTRSATAGEQEGRCPDADDE